MDEFDEALNDPLVRASIQEMWKKLGPMRRGGVNLCRVSILLNADGRQVICDVTVKGGSYSIITMTPMIGVQS